MERELEHHGSTAVENISRIGIEVLEIPRVPTESKQPITLGVPQGQTSNDTAALLIGWSLLRVCGVKVVHHSNTFRVGDVGYRAKRARQRKLEFKEHASTCFDLDAKRKVRTKEEDDFSKKMEVDKRRHVQHF